MKKKGTVTQFSVSFKVLEYAVLCGVYGIDWIYLDKTYSQYYLN